MHSVTGIELGADACVLARVRPDREQTRVSAVHGLSAGDWDSGRTLSDNLRAVRRAKRFPRRARVVAWGLDAGSPASSPAAKAVLAPVLDAGFSVDAVLSPPDALALLAARHPRPAGRDAEAWLALNRHGAAIAIVRGRRLLFSRTFEWHYRTATSAKDELLQRYSLLSHLAVELRHAFDMVRRQHGIPVDAIVTCGNLPDLRSMTMPLIEELDIEVETLDTMEGLAVSAPARVDDVNDKAPAVRLACAAAVGTPAASVRQPPRMWLAAAAAAALLALLLWTGMRGFFEPTTPAEATNRTAPPQPAGTAGEQPPPPDGVAMQPVRRAPPRAPEVEQTPSVVTGRPARPVAQSALEKGRRRPAPAATRAPLNDPLPVVNSILVSTNRRLAVLDGAIVREGEHIGPRVLVRIEPGEVVLREPSGREVRVAIRRKVGSAGSGTGI